MLEKAGSLESLKAKDIMSKMPITVTGDLLAVEALEIMKTKNISQLIVADKMSYNGVIHIHDVIKEGII